MPISHTTALLSTICVSSAAILLSFLMRRVIGLNPTPHRQQMHAGSCDVAFHKMCNRADRSEQRGVDRIYALISRKEAPMPTHIKAAHWQGL
jgi:hypothetical protein